MLGHGHTSGCYSNGVRLEVDLRTLSGIAEIVESLKGRVFCVVVDLIEFRDTQSDLLGIIQVGNFRK